MTPPYEVTQADRSGSERMLSKHATLEVALRSRDTCRSLSDHWRIYFRVLDADDAERGEAEWCGECGERGTFTYACEECE